MAPAVKLYLDTEAHVTPGKHESLGDAANVVCSIARAMEHLLKLRLLRLDPALLYRMPMPHETHVAVKRLAYRSDRKPQNLESLNTIGFSEALRRVSAAMPADHVSLNAFSQARRLRDVLEHHWDDNVSYLSSIVGEMSSQTIPALQAFASDILKEDPGLYLNAQALGEVERLDRTIAQAHSLALQQRIETQRVEWKQNPRVCKSKYRIPYEYDDAEVIMPQALCPVCGNSLCVSWRFEVAMDSEVDDTLAFAETGSVVTQVVPTPKCIWCGTCHFYAEGKDMTGCLPSDLGFSEDESYPEDCDVPKSEMDKAEDDDFPDHG